MHVMTWVEEVTVQKPCELMTASRLTVPCQIDHTFSVGTAGHITNRTCIIGLHFSFASQSRHRKAMPRAIRGQSPELCSKC